MDLSDLDGAAQAAAGVPEREEIERLEAQISDLRGDHAAMDLEELAEAAAEMVSRYVNVMGVDLDLLADAWMRDHRTLLQLKMTLLAKIIVRMAESCSDLRNEAAVRLAKEIVGAVPRVAETAKHGLPYI